MYLAQIVTSSRDGLHEEFLDMYTTFGNALHGIESRIYRAVAGSRLDERIAPEAHPDGSRRYGGRAAHHLKRFEFERAVHFRIRTGEDFEVAYRYIFFLSLHLHKSIGKFSSI